MLICPLLQKECIGEKCSWWYQGIHVEVNKCVIALLKPELTEITSCVQFLIPEN
jgi:hypothetical protein